MQQDEGGFEHPVCFFSRKFNFHQRAYSTIEKEALALVLAVQHFEVYVGGAAQPVLVFTDHNTRLHAQQPASKAVESDSTGAQPRD